jgi:hypothetical protein
VRAWWPGGKRKACEASPESPPSTTEVKMGESLTRKSNLGGVYNNSTLYDIYCVLLLVMRKLFASAPSSTRNGRRVRYTACAGLGGEELSR